MQSDAIDVEMHNLSIDETMEAAFVDKNDWISGDESSSSEDENDNSVDFYYDPKTSTDLDDDAYLELDRALISNDSGVNIIKSVSKNKIKMNPSTLWRHRNAYRIDYFEKN